MDTKPFKDIVVAAGDEERSARWYVQAVQQYARGVNSFQEVVRSDLGEAARTLDVGKMYMFSYDPKWKETLPYYDTVPLVIITEPTATGFSGINLHYLAPMLRANLLDKLLPADGGTIDNKSTLRSAWSFVKNFSRFPEVRGSVKKYLSQNITGRMIEVDPQHWKSAIFLPVQKFVGANERYVYKQTMDKPTRKRRMTVSVK